MKINLDERSFWTKLRRFIGRIPFAVDLLAIYYCMKDPETDLWAKAIILSALIYFVMPLDAIPDWLPGGFVDDAAAVAAAIKAVGSQLKPRHYAQARRALLVDEPSGAAV